MQGLRFYITNARFLAFGMLLLFFTSYGQTFFIGVYGTDIRETFDLTNGEFGNWYLLITLGSALGLNRLGHLIDKIPLGKWIIILSIIMALFMLLIAFGQTFVLVFAGILVVRLISQGLLTVTAMTAMTRYFDVGRGRAVAIAVLGMPIGQAIFPPLAVYLIAATTWQLSWAIMSASLIIIGLPLLLWLLKGHGLRHAAHLEKISADKASESQTGQIHFGRKDVLKDFRFYLFLPALLLTPFWVTGMFFFAEPLADAKSWGLTRWTSLYWVNALGAIAVPFLVGHLVDKYSSRKLVIFYPVLIILAFVSLMYDDNIMWAASFLLFVGAALGMSATVNNALWAELYGTAHLGEVKSLGTSFVIVSTALAPALIGAGMDAGMSILDFNTYAVAHGIIAIICLIPIALEKRRLK